MIQAYSNDKNVGSVVFMHGTPEKIFQMIQEEHQFLYFFWQDQWDLRSRQYNYLLNNNVLDHIKELKVKQLKMRWNNAKNIFVQIKNLKLFNMLELYLNGNNIQNIQALAQLKMPNIKVLNLKQNKITSITAFKKLDLSHLAQVSLYSNTLTSVKSLQRSKFVNLQKLWILPQIGTERMTEQPLVVPFKCSLPAIKELYLFSIGRIQQNQDKIKPMLNNSFSQTTKLKPKLKDDFHLYPYE